MLVCCVLVVVSTVAVIVADSGVAGATPTEVTTDAGWYRGSLWPTGLGTNPGGTCNLRYELPTGNILDHSWGFSEACQLDTTMSKTLVASALEGGIKSELPDVGCYPDPNFQGCTNGTGSRWVNDESQIANTATGADYSNVAAGWGSVAGCDPRAAGGPCNQGYAAVAYVNSGYGGAMRAVGYADTGSFFGNAYGTSGLSSDGHDLHSLCTVPVLGVNVTSACRSAVGADVSAWTSGYPYSYFDAGETVSAVLVCSIQYLSIGDTASAGSRSVGIRQDCWVPSFSVGGGSFVVDYRAPGTTVSDCANGHILSAVNDANAYIGGGSGQPEIHMSIGDISCTQGGSGVGAEAVMPDHYYTGGLATGGACGAMLVSPSTVGAIHQVAGDPQTFDVTFTGGADWLEVDPGDHASGSTVITGLPGTWPDDAVGAPTPDSPFVAVITADTTGDYRVAVRCNGGGATYSFTSPQSAVPGTNPLNLCNSAGCWQSLVSCLNGSGLSLSPSSWVPGLLKDTACVLSWAFVPASVNTTSLTAPFTTNFPGTWFVDFGSAVGTVVAGVTGSLGSPCVSPDFGVGAFVIGGRSVPGMKMALPVPPSAGCGGSTANGSVGELFGVRVLMRNIESLCTWVTAVLVIWKMLPWRKHEGDDPPAGTGTFNEGSWARHRNSTLGL